MLRSSAPPTRSAVFAAFSACDPCPMVYQAALVVRVMPASVNRNGVLVPPAARPRYASLSTLIWALICASVTSPAPGGPDDVEVDRHRHRARGTLHLLATSRQGLLEARVLLRHLLPFLLVVVLRRTTTGQVLEVACGQRKRNGEAHEDEAKFFG